MDEKKSVVMSWPLRRRYTYFIDIVLSLLTHISSFHAAMPLDVINIIPSLTDLSYYRMIITGVRIRLIIEKSSHSMSCNF